MAIINGTANNNILKGGKKDDTIYGGAGRDRLYGGKGDDILYAGSNTGLEEYVYGGRGNDTFVITTDTGRVALWAGDGADDSDIVIFKGFSVSDIEGVTKRSGGKLEISVKNENGDVEHVTLRDVKNFEAIQFEDYGPASLKQFVKDYKAGFIEVPDIKGTNKDNVLLGTNQSESIYGFEGNDTLIASEGADVFYGGAGTDLVSYKSVSMGLLIDTENPQASTGLAKGDTFDSIERIVGTKHDDILTGAIDRFYGGAGDDLLIANGESQFLYGGVGSDTFRFSQETSGSIVGFSGSNFGESSQNDKIDLSEWGVSKIEQLEFSRLFQGGSRATNDLLIQYGDNVLRVWNAFENVDDDLSLKLSWEDFQLVEQNSDDRFDSFAIDPFVSEGQSFDLKAIEGTTGENSYSHEFHRPEINLVNSSHLTEDESILWRGFTSPVGWNGNIATTDKHIATQGIDVLFLGSGDTFQRHQSGDERQDYMAQLGAATDLVFAGAGNDLITGGGGGDILFGQDGDDMLDGGTYGDFLFGGRGRDFMTGGAMNDGLFGGAGEDILEGGFALDVLFGGSGNDVIISRSDSGEPNRVVETMRDVVSKSGQTGSLIHGSLLSDQSNDFNPVLRPEFSGVQTNDHLDGGDGQDLFVFEFTIGADVKTDVLHSDDVTATMTQDRLNNHTIDWARVAGLNDYRHQHWMDGIGNDRIYNFEIDHDEMAFIGHTVQVKTVQFLDDNDDGLTDTRIELFSNHVDNHGNPLSHHNDNLGSVTLMGVRWDVTAAELNGSRVFDVPVHHMTSDRQKWFESDIPLISSYLEKYDGLEFNELVNEFGSFKTFNAANSYFSTNLSQIKNTQSEDGDQLRAHIEGSNNNDILHINGVGGFVEAGAGNDVIIGSQEYIPQFHRDFIDGGSGDDIIFGGTQDDMIFGGSGNDIVLGGSMGKKRSFGDEDGIFGGAGNDILSGGVQGDLVSGGAGDDILLSASEISSGEYNPQDFRFGGGGSTSSSRTTDFTHEATHRVTNDVLSGGKGSDKFVFDILNAEATNTKTGKVGVIDVYLGTDIITDFTSEDGIYIQFHGSNAGGRTYEVEDITISDHQAAIITLISDRTDNLYSSDGKGGIDYKIVETEETAVIGQIVVLGANSQQVEKSLYVSLQSSQLMTSNDFYNNFEFGSENGSGIILADGSEIIIPTIPIEEFSDFKNIEELGIDLVF